ncbi:MAG: intradiol ring-cleavage dioxygenase [Acidimicrobiales bacterium]
MPTVQPPDRLAPADGHDDFGGLGRDLPHLVGRRRALQMIGGISLAGIVAACGTGSDNTDSAGASSTNSTTSTASSTESASAISASAGAEIPEETQGPYPADGSNGPNILGESGIVRADLTSSFGDLSGTADGVPMTVQLTIVDAPTGEPRPGAALYAWHCTADGQYSIYEIVDQNYLRGVQVADDAGRLAFTTVFPGCYAGRWPHVHFEVYDSLDAATAGSQSIKTSQLALPESDGNAVYADGRYGNSATNLSRLSLNSDMVFSDGWSDQLATLTGTVSDGYTASLLVRV